MIPSAAEKPLLPETELYGGGVSRKGAFFPFLIFSAVLLAVFSKILFDLAVFAFKTNVHSHILLVPFISGYLVWQMRDSLPAPRRTVSALPISLAVFGFAVLAVFFVLRVFRGPLAQADYLFLTVLPFCCFFAASVLFFLGKRFAKEIAFPLVFLFFLAPFPNMVTDALEIASQNASAEAYSWLMSLTGATYYREGRTFFLPSISIVVAQECSGIRSSLVLFLTSLIAGHMFLRTTWKKVLLAVAVFPLGIFRNAFRIYVLSMLSEHWDPNVLDSPLHHRGGPIFFVLSLIPFFLLLIWLRKRDGIQNSRVAPVKS